MKRIKHVTLLCFLIFSATAVVAQRGIVASGGDATGTGGSMSYSIGQVEYLAYTSAQGSISLGLQQSWFTVPTVFEIPNISVTTGTSVCFDATQTVILGGNGKSFIVEPNAHADVIAGKNIIMKKGTNVESGGSFHAFISTMWCDQPESMLATTETEPVIIQPIIETSLQNDFFNVYPNPTKDNFTLELNEVDVSSPLLIEIYTIHGNLIFRSEIQAIKKQQFSLVGMPSGLYIVRLKNQQETGITKIVKQ
ncbi:MAG: T9SS type A sorting domain-containing protein [Bacteroidales bacterium]